MFRYLPILDSISMLGTSIKLKDNDFQTKTVQEYFSHVGVEFSVEDKPFIIRARDAGM